MIKSLSFLAVLLSSILLVGCGGAPKEAKIDVIGYFCPECRAKFYTKGETYASKCPGCGQVAIEQVTTYICDVDNEKTIAQSTRAGAQCQKCRKQVTTAKYSTEEELQNWGAALKSAEEVGAAQ